MEIKIRKDQKVAKNLDLIKAEIEDLYEEQGDSLYIMIQAAYMQRYGAIPSVGAVCNWLKKQGLAGTKKAYAQRATQGSYYTVRGNNTYIMCKVGEGKNSYWEMEHILVAKQLGLIDAENSEGLCIHHRDHNSLNNEASNLVAMTRSEHSRLHALQRWSDPEYKERMTRKIRSAAAKRKLAKRIAEINGTQAA